MRERFDQIDGDEWIGGSSLGGELGSCIHQVPWSHCHCYQ